ncbi:MAG TPA: hypothetical protein VFF06_18740 [Polyangia bacterium]|nr:hypothetical protein [Polyangia bacterium]
MDAARAVKSVSDGIGLARIAPFWSRVDDSGIVHETQLKTAIDCLVELRDSPKRCGHVVGAMQSGKTTTSLALQWAGPALYLLTGRRAYPFYIIGSQTTHEDQTNTELDRFMAYYGNLEILSDSTESSSSLDAVFAMSPSLANYREHVLRDALPVYSVPHLEDLVHRRVGGDQGVRKIGDLCRRATEQGYRPLMIIDEPQFGASDRMVDGDSGPVRRPCVLVQIFDRIEQEIGATREDHWFVGLSATPFELNDLERVWEVRQHLTDNYSGFNFFNGRPIDEGVVITPPDTMSMSDFADEIDVPFIADISMAAYDGPTARFARHAKKIGYDDDQASYQMAVEDALRSAIYAVLERYHDDGHPVGLCIRAFNDNARTQALIGRLKLDDRRIEVIEYYGPQSANLSVKRAIAGRARPDLPYVVFVTNRARMADAFPVEVRFFMDLAQKASDLNALLQGLLGRACGYGKDSTVVLSDANAGIVDAYVATNGGYVHKTSRHSIAVGGFRRGAPAGMIKLRVEMDDPTVKSFFREIDKQVVAANIKDGSTKLNVPRASKGSAKFRTGPILTIADTLGLFDHLERPEVRTLLFPQIPTGFKIARSGDSVRHARQAGVMLGYTLDAAGNCRYTFRWSDRDSAARGGAAGRAMGKKDSVQHMEPTIYVEKFDPATGEVISDQLPGNWRAFMVTFPLREPVREIRAAQVAYPTKLSPYDGWMVPEERAARDQAQQPKGTASPSSSS